MVESIDDGRLSCDCYLLGEVFNGVSEDEVREFIKTIDATTHNYKGESNNSKRLKMIGASGVVQVLLNRNSWSRRMEKNNEERKRKVDSLPTFQIDEEKKFPLSLVRDVERPLFFSGETTCEFGRERLPPNSRYLPVTKHLTIIDSVSGCHMKGVCTLFPRQEALMTYRTKARGALFNSLISVATNVEQENSRQASKHRRVIVENGKSGRYVAHGWFAYRNKRGVSEHCLNNVDVQEEALMNIYKLVKNVEDRAHGYLDLKELLFNEIVKQHSNCAGMTFLYNKKSTIWPSMAFAKNAFLNAHRDEDYFWSITTVVTKSGYDLDSDIATYFCFPTEGFCVALRPGDILMFNSCVDHCVSSKRDSYGNVVGLSMYLKTAVVAGNDNSKK
jgi:hypothetical protein